MKAKQDPCPLSIHVTTEISCIMLPYELQQILKTESDCLNQQTNPSLNFVNNTDMTLKCSDG